MLSRVCCQVRGCVGGNFHAPCVLGVGERLLVELRQVTLPFGQDELMRYAHQDVDDVSRSNLTPGAPSNRRATLLFARTLLGGPRRDRLRFRIAPPRSSCRGGRDTPSASRSFRTPRTLATDHRASDRGARLLSPAVRASTSTKPGGAWSEPLDWLEGVLIESKTRAIVWKSIMLVPPLVHRLRRASRYRRPPWFRPRSRCPRLAPASPYVAPPMRPPQAPHPLPRPRGT